MSWSFDSFAPPRGQDSPPDGRVDPFELDPQQEYRLLCHASRISDEQTSGPESREH
jgi:hypothetical protein